MSASQPKTIRAAAPVPLATAASTPAVAGDPASTAVATRRSRAPPGGTSITPPTSTNSGARRKGPAAPEGSDARAAAAAPPGHGETTSSASPAPMANAGREPRGRDHLTATPAIMVDSGMAACFVPKASPCRLVATARAIRSLLAGCPMPLPHPATIRAPTSTGVYWAARAMTSIEMAPISADRRTTGDVPKRRTTVPAVRAATAEAEKKEATRRPSSDGPNPRSSRSCTHSTPTM